MALCIITREMSKCFFFLFKPSKKPSPLNLIAKQIFNLCACLSRPRLRESLSYASVVLSLKALLPVKCRATKDRLYDN